MAAISSVKDPLTGSNYGGINTDPVGINASYKKYLDNLFETVQRPVSGPLRQEQYTPSAGESSVIGQISSKTLGSMPIFGSGSAIFPQAILDNYKRAQQESELAYLNEIGNVSPDVFKLSATLKNPWHNQAFSAKYQSALDGWLDAAANQFGGDYKKGMVALQGNKDYLRMMKSYEDYAAIYNAVFDDAVNILSTKPEKGYVTPEKRKAAQKFLNDYENLDEMTIDKLASNARNFQSVVAVGQVVDLVIGDGETLSDTLIESYSQAYNMGTDKKNVWKKTATQGLSEAQLEKYYDLAAQAYPDEMKDPIFAKFLKSEIRNRVGWSVKESIDQIERGEAKETTYLNNNGIDVDKDGKVQTIDKMPTAFEQYSIGRSFATGTNGIQYPSRDMNGQPVSLQTSAGMKAYVITPDAVHYVVLPGSYAFKPEKEYDLLTLSGPRGRVVEGQISIAESGLYTKEYTKTPIKEGVVGETVATGEKGPTTTEKIPLIVRDLNTGLSVDLYGTYSIVAPFDSMKDELNTAYPFLKRTHADFRDTEHKKPIVLQKAAEVTTAPIELSPKDTPDTSKWPVGQKVIVKGVEYTWNGTKLKK